MKYILTLISLLMLCIQGIGQTTFSYTGTVQTYTVPTGVTSITVDVQGAKGGGVECAYGTYQSHGGCGGRVQATVAVTPGHVLNITVANVGSNTGAGGYGGGGSDATFTSVWPGAGGGGASRIVDNTTGTLLVVAGGGGGGGGDFCPGTFGLGDFGGDGGNTTGAAGNSNICGTGNGGQGGTPTAGGAACVCSPYTGSAGSLGTGGNCSSGLGSGGGGGGYYGGGSGAYGAGGGGGSSYANGTYASGVTYTQGYNCGVGTVIINVACTPPSSITGTTFTVCSGSSITLSDATSGGTWSSSATGVATVTSGGVVTGVGTGGVATISYTISTGCYAIANVTVNPLPVTPTGPTVMCAGTTATLTDGSGTCTWTSSNTGVATVGPTSGVVYALSSGTTTIGTTLTATGCSSSEVITVNPSVAPITGTEVVCQGATVTLSDPTPSGTWSSSATGTATVSGSGVVTGGTAGSGGTVTISYTLSTGCFATALVTVNPIPAVITGSHTVCLLGMVTLSDASSPAGTWSSSATGIAPIGSSSGIVTGSAVGTATITYSYPSTGCYVTYGETVNALPSIIVGSSTVCANTGTLLTDSVAGGIWSSSATGFASISGIGYVTGASAGTTTISYQLGTGCYATKSITVLPIPANITGDSTVCSGSTITEADITGSSTWSLTGIGASINSTTGVITAASTAIVPVTDSVFYTIIATGCKVKRPITVNPLPGAIAGVLLICDSSTTVLFDGLLGGTWTSSNTSIATINPITGVVYGSIHGLDTISYTMPMSGCMATATLTVAPPPAPISGSLHVCPMLTTTLTDGISGGVWLSGTPGIATIDSFSGVISGISTGNTVITYVLGVCSTTILATVDPLPALISGNNFVCTNGGTTSLSDGTPGGHWFSNNTTGMLIDSLTGVMTGLVTGTDIVTYKLTGTGCYQTENITVEPLPDPIMGADSVCLGYTTVISDPSSGGMFSSASTAIASVTSMYGVVTGVSAGITTLTYTLAGTGCQITTSFKVNPILSASTMIGVIPGDTVCAGSMVTYSATSVNGGAGPVYTWKVNGVTVTGATGSTYSYSPSNGDVVSCVLTSDATCAIPNTALSNTVNMVVNPVTNPTVTMHQNLGDTVCTGSTLTFNVTSTSGGSSPQYLWTVNWMPVATGVTSYVYTPVNGDIIRCGMVSSSACPVPDTAFAIDTMVVYGYDTPKVSLFNPGGMAVCEGQPITIIANTQWGGWGPNYYWSLNGTPMSSSGDSYTYMPHDSDSVTVMVVSNYQCTVPGDTVYSSVRIEVDPVIIVTITDSYGGLLSVGWSDTLVAHVQNGGLDPTYQWYRNGIMVPGANYYKFARSDFEEKDSISCVVTTGAGSACEGVKGHNWMILEVAPVGVGQIGTSIAQLRIEPNPNKGEFEIAGTSTGTAAEATVVVTSVVGQEVYRGKAGIQSGRISGHISLDAGLPDGMYLLHIKSEGAENVLRFALKH